MADDFTNMVFWHRSMMFYPDDAAAIPDASGVTVAIVDTGVNRSHPQLAGQIDDDRIVDLVTSTSGLSARPTSQALPFTSAILNDLNLSDVDRDAIADVVQDVIDDMKLRKVTVNKAATALRDFSSHGTACAGLVAAKPRGGNEEPKSLNDFLEQNYAGMAPGCRIIPINTSMSPNEEPLILALLYCLHYKVDVIHLPRGVNDQWVTEPAPAIPPNATDIATKRYKLLIAEWDRRKMLGHALRALFIAVSKKIPIVCAAGNSAESHVAYPANLSNDDNGIISVGAVTRKGFRSGYSNYGEGTDVVAPSDDSEVFNRNQVRVNPLDPSFKMHEYTAYANAILPKTEYCADRVVTIDIPGKPGYVGLSKLSEVDTDPLRNWIDQLSGDFTMFGGTSAASAIAAGVCALIVAKSKNKSCDGPWVKKVLKMTASMDYSNTLAPGGVTKLKVDKMNENARSDAPFLFGSGLINVEKALAQAQPA